jgi:hypothetical protein
MRRKPGLFHDLAGAVHLTAINRDDALGCASLF